MLETVFDFVHYTDSHSPSCRHTLSQCPPVISGTFPRDSAAGQQPPAMLYTLSKRLHIFLCSIGLASGARLCRTAAKGRHFF
ncbi:MAG: hypothetical protein IAC51_06765 [bacterium]|uniref:Uncharacterized protein n=1 Tax=Candidatus Aphodosoma intestinipullorum TaxID=2840674 RepID=A0A940DM82_9BACT|nr:hypothetical protein [Candidatus Aphodosoma intestinipullorum]